MQQQATISVRLTTGKGGRRHGRLTRLVFILAFVMILLSAVSLAYVGNIASREADAQATQNQRQLLNNVLTGRMQIMSRDLYSIVHWDDAVTGLVKTLDQEFVSDQLIYWLDLNLQAQRTFIVSAGGRVLADIVNSQAQFSRRTLPGDDPLMQIARDAVNRFVALRVPVDSGYGLKTISLAQVSDLAATAVVKIDGQPALVTAMVVTPDDQESLPSKGDPVVVIAAKTLDSTLLRELNQVLSFQNFTFEQPDEADGLRTTQMVAGPDGKPVGQFAWRAAQPGTVIRSVVMPIILAVCGVMTAITAFAAYRIGGLSSKLEESEERNRFLALHDNLTGLSNRFHFHEALDRHISSLPQNEFAVLACDLDRFKHVNDTYGHAAGDAVIRAVANRIAGAVGTAGMVGRVGGDEFVILLSGFTDIPRLQILCCQIIASVCEPIMLDNGVMTSVGVSLGVALAPASGSTNTHLMASADAALYAAKEQGRGCAVFAHELPQRPKQPPEVEAGAEKDDAAHRAA
ncbi:MAG TPA: diguanylate cyclase [Ensifer sp.]|nr:diguanylate cyclase [Ensifer sp.]